MAAGKVGGVIVGDVEGGAGAVEIAGSVMDGVEGQKDRGIKIRGVIEDGEDLVLERAFTFRAGGGQAEGPARGAERRRRERVRGGQAGGGGEGTGMDVAVDDHGSGLMVG